MLTVSAAELHALAAGEVVTAFVDRGRFSEGDEVEIVPGEPSDPSLVKPAYRRWLAEDPPEGSWTAVVVAVDPARMLDPEAGKPRHLLAATPEEGDVLVLRVFGPDGPVLGEDAFAARRASVEGALR